MQRLLARNVASVGFLSSANVNTSVQKIFNSHQHVKDIKFGPCQNLLQNPPRRFMSHSDSNCWKTKLGFTFNFKSDRPYCAPTNDYAFKKLFLHKNIVTHFLNAALKLSGDEMIKKVTFLPKDVPSQDTLYVPCKSGGNRKKRIHRKPDLVGLHEDKPNLDMICEDRSGGLFAVEMQVLDEPRFFVKDWNLCHAHYREAKKEKGTEAMRREKSAFLRKAKTLSIARFDCFPQKKDLISIHKMVDVTQLEKIFRDSEKEKRVSFEKMLKLAHNIKSNEHVIISLPKFKPEDMDVDSALDKWLWLFVQGNEASKQDVANIYSAKGDDIFRKAWEILDEASWTQDERKEAFYEWDAWQKRTGEYESAVEEGRQIARAEVVRSLHRNNCSLDEIAGYVQLPVSEVQKILDANKK